MKCSHIIGSMQSMALFSGLRARGRTTPRRLGTSYVRRGAQRWSTTFCTYLDENQRNSERSMLAITKPGEGDPDPVPQRVSGATRSTPRRRLERGRVCGDERSETPSCPFHPASMWPLWSAGCSVLGARFVVLRRLQKTTTSTTS